ncbi:flagellin Hag [Priestia aryabhattai]|uniref:flagellin Hag n=1 Tax=Priestia aryabhattai TaxID=412384 RepID=UPI00234F8427|nr:flagellin Hag [Priestia aryabhattai]MDC7762496.1 flagellin Hag [Priestia aryabhattai]
MRINHNITALNTYGKLNSANNAQAKSMEKLSSGLRINSAADDAAGLAISEKMRSQVRGLDQASKNAQDGISMIQTAEGALGETHDILQRMRELSVQASNDTNTSDDRNEIQKEMNQLTSEVSRIGNTTEFNTQSLLNGNKEGTADATKDGAVALQIGANQGQQFTVTINDMRAAALGIAGDAGGDATGVTGAKFTAVGTENDLTDVSAEGEHALDISTATSASAATKVLDQAIKTVSSERSRLGAYQNRLDHTVNNLSTSSENLTAAESRIRDVDMAKEMMEQTKNSILSQASQAMLGQANQQPQNVLQLLR